MKQNPNFFAKKANNDGHDEITIFAPKRGPPQETNQNQKKSEPVEQGLSGKALEGALKRAMQSGTLGLQNRGLKNFPKEILNIQNLNLGVNWFEGFELTKVDLSNNQIESIPDEIALQEFIQHLNLSSNLIKSLPNGLFALKNLKLLDISNNKIGSDGHGYISEAIAEAHSLVELRASGNMIVSLPSSIGDLKNLEVIDLRDNRISELPDRFGCISKLLKLNLDQNQLKDVPICIGSLTRLMELSMAKNQIKQIQNDCLANLESLVMLDLHQNMLQDFTAVPNSEKLDTLALSYNQLHNIDGLQKARHSITVLDLHNNKLSQIPDSIYQLYKLKTLIISNNNLNNLDARLSLLPDLVRISIEGNPLRSIKPSLRTANAVQLKQYLKMRLDDNDLYEEEKKIDVVNSVPGATQAYDHWGTLLREFIQKDTLDLKSKNLTEISPKLFAYKNLTVLDLSNNPALCVIPDDIDKLVGLKTLRWSGNNVQSLPNNLLTLKDLDTLELNKNKISQFFDGQNKHNLVSLTYLSLNANQLLSAPPICRRFPKLQQLHLHMNKLTNLNEICRPAFDKLQVLDVGNNKIQELPVAFVHYLSSLNNLCIINNDLMQLPNLIGFHKKLSNLQIDGNPLKSIRRQVIDKGTVGIMAYQRERYVQGKDDVIEPWAVQMVLEDAEAQKQVEYSAKDVKKEVPGWQMVQPEKQEYFTVDRPQIQYHKTQLEAQQHLHGHPLHTPVTIVQAPPQQLLTPFDMVQNQRIYQPDQPMQMQSATKQPVANRNIEQERQQIDAQIVKLQQNLDNNFSMSRMQINETKKEISKLNSIKQNLN